MPGHLALFGAPMYGCCSVHFSGLEEA